MELNTDIGEFHLLPRCPPEVGDYYNLAGFCGYWRNQIALTTPSMSDKGILRNGYRGRGRSLRARALGFTLGPTIGLVGC